MGRGLDGFLLLARPSAVFKLHGGRLETFRWRDSERETPLPIPNRAVKPLSADGTWRATARESRSPPVFLKPPQGGFFRSVYPHRTRTWLDAGVAERLPSTGARGAEHAA